MKLVGREQRRRPTTVLIEPQRRARLEIVRPHAEARVIRAAQLPAAGRSEEAPTRRVIDTRRLPAELNRLHEDVAECERGRSLEGIGFRPRLRKNDGLDLPAPISAQDLRIGHPSYAGPDLDGRDRWARGDRLALLIFDRVGFVEIRGEEDTESRRRLTSIL